MDSNDGFGGGDRLDGGGGGGGGFRGRADLCVRIRLRRDGADLCIFVFY